MHLYLRLCSLACLCLLGTVTPVTKSVTLSYFQDLNPAFAFTENRGQVADESGNPRPEVLFTAEGKGINLYFTTTGIKYIWQKTESRPTSQDPIESLDFSLLERYDSMKVSYYAVEMRLLGSNPTPEIIKEEPTTDYLNFYLPHCPEGITHVSRFQKIIYQRYLPSHRLGSVY